MTSPRHGVTYDTAMLIGLERRRQRCWEIHERASEVGIQVSVPWVVVVEWWRGRTDDRHDILQSIEVERPSETLAKLAGESLAAVQTKRADAACRSKLLVDAVVMASASLRGDLVYTGDFDDLSRFSVYFPSVRVFGV